MSRDTVRPRTNRKADEAVCTKGHSRVCFSPMFSDTGFFVIGEAQAERGKECMYEYMTDRAKTATKPNAKKAS